MRPLTRFAMPSLLPGLILATLLLWVSTAQAQTPGPATFEVIARDGRLLPQRLEVPAGVKLKLILKNESRMPVEFENLDLRIEKVLATGASSFVVIHPLRPGRYHFVDEFNPEGSGMLLIAR